MSNTTIEVRCLCAADLRTASTGRRISGYAAVFNSLSETLYGSFREKIRPGAFSRTLAKGADVRALIDHDPSKILGRSKSGTLTLNEDSRGLHFSVDVPDTSTGKDILESVRRGDVSQASFGFTVIEDEWNRAHTIRELVEVELYDVSVVTFPAYPQTSVITRSECPNGDGTELRLGWYGKPNALKPADEKESDYNRLSLMLRVARLIN